MKNPPRKNGDSSRKRRVGAPESRASKETFPRRTDRPGKAGLANEARPGLGTRREDSFPVGGAPGDGKLPMPDDDFGDDDEPVAGRQRSSREPNDRPLPRKPQEQRSDSWERESERSTSSSGRLGL